MIIAFVSDAIYPYNKGGKEKRLHELSIRLAKMGNEVHIYTMKWWDGPKDRIEEGVHLHGIGKLHNLYVRDRRSIKGGMLFGFACIKLINKKFDVADVDHIPYFPLYSMWLVCLIKDKPMFGTWHEVWGKNYWKHYLGSAGFIAAFMEKLSIRFPRDIIAISQHTSERLNQVLNYKNVAEVLSPGLDFNGIRAIMPAKKKTDIIYAGRLLKHKNLDMVVKAVAALKKDGQKVKCLIIGEGPEKRKLVNLADRLGVSSLIEFKGFLPSHDDLYSNFKSSKVFVLPSSREGFGIVAIEANACGIPVLTNFAPDNAAKDLINNGSNGFHFEDGVDSLIEMLKVSLLRAEVMEQKCIDFASNFDWDKLAKHSMEIYSQ